MICSLLAVLAVLLVVFALLLLDHDILVCIGRCGDCFNVTTNDALVIRVSLLALRANHVQVVANKAMSANWTPVGGSGQRADDAGANEDGEVEAILRVPFRGYKWLVSVKC